MRALRVVLAILVVLLVAAAVVAWTMPAQFAWRLVAARLPVLQLQGVEGSVWHGSAAAASVAGQPLGRLQWTLAALPLLRGDLHAATELAGASLHAHGTVVRHRDGAIDIRDAHVEAPAAPLQQALSLGGVQPLGTISADIADARIRNAWFEALDATVHWRDAGVVGSAQARFGAINAVFSLDAQRRVHGEIRDDGKGPLAVDGRFDAEPDGYTLTARLAARDAQDWQTQEALQYLGQRQSDGSVLLRAEGHLLLATPR
jgi:general secretion pathway protein N